jgi:hypothetical protein
MRPRTWGIPPFYWDDTNGHTVGYSHDHPDSGPDVDDLSLGYQLYLQHLYHSPTADQNFFKTNFAITTITPYGSYIVSVRNWDAYADVIKDNYGNDLPAMDAAWQRYAQEYLTNNPNGNDGDAAAYALMQIFGSTIYIFYKAPNQSDYQPIKANSSYGITITPCTD